jgi:hypothetical protein
VLLEPIGEGAQGRTFDAVDKREGRAVAIKRFDVRGATTWKDVELAEREARVLQSLSHPKLPAYIDHFEEDGSLYLVMEKIAGESLASLRSRGAVLGENEVVRLLRDASEVLDYLHGRAPPVIHRDLKPGNVIRRPDGSFAFVDFGAVRDKLRPRGGSTVVGTFGYMAPEQVQGRALPASDVYAIGATALAMLTRCEPEELPHRGLAIDVRRALQGRTSARFVDVLERMLDPDPDRRAARIAPLLARLDGAGRSQERGSRRAGDRQADGWADWADRYGRQAERRARHAARRAARAPRRAGVWREGRGHPFPWPARLMFAVLFTFGIIAVSVATQVVVPLVLRLLSLFFARRALTTAASEVRRAGDVAVEGMAASRRWFLGEFVPVPAGDSQAAHVRVGEGAEVSIPQTRVAEESLEPDAVDEASESLPGRESIRRPIR